MNEELVTGDKGVGFDDRNGKLIDTSVELLKSDMILARARSKLALEATQLGFKVGVRVNIDVLNAQAQLYTTQAQLAKARYDLIMAGLRLRQASGRLTPDDVASVNGLLIR